MTKEKETPVVEEAAPPVDVKVRDKVLYCIGYRETGNKLENGNWEMEPEYANAVVQEVDEDRRTTGHVLLIYDRGGIATAAWAHNATGLPGYWTSPTSEP